MKFTTASIVLASAAAAFAASSSVTSSSAASTATSPAVPELPPIPNDRTTPVQQRIAFNGPTGMTIAWNTFQQLSNPSVKYGLSPNLLFFSASSQSSVTYPTSRTWANTVQIKNLLPGTKYYYQIVSGNSTVDSFRTARLAGDPTPYSMAAVVDMGVFGPDGLSTRPTGYTGIPITDQLAIGEHTTIQALVADRDNYEFVAHPGDFAYADAWQKELKAKYINGTNPDPAGQIYEGLNEQFWQEYSAVSKEKALMVSAGNHEANCDNSKGTVCPMGQTNFTGFINRFGIVMPSSPQTPFGKRAEYPTEGNGQEKKREMAKRSAQLNGALPPFWYSYDYASTHFIHYDTETDLIDPDTGLEIPPNENSMFGLLGQQKAFIQQDLASVNRALTPWVVAMGHRPYYVANSGLSENCQVAFEKLFYEGGVDLVMTGHTHNMEVITPIYQNVTDPAGFNNPRAPAYVVNGAAGHWEGLDALQYPLPSYVTYANDQSYGYTKLNFLDRNHLRIDMIASANSSVVYSQTLYKKH